MTYQGGSSGQQQQKPRKAYVAAITGAANNGSGLIRITSAGNKFNDQNNVTIASVGGTVEANGNWVINKINGNSFDLKGSTFTNAYTSGGTATRH